MKLSCPTAFHLTLLALATSFTSYTTGSQSFQSQFLSEEGSGSGDDEYFSGLFSDVRRDVIIRCYKCTGDGDDRGCNVTKLRQSPELFLMDCDGHCLNITTGRNTVLDCTEKVSTKTSHCFQKDQVTMCVCGTDYCNGPSSVTNLDSTQNLVVELPSSQHEIQLLEEHQLNVELPGAYLMRAQNDNNTHTNSGSSSSIEDSTAAANCGARLSGCVGVFSFFIVLVVKFWLCFDDVLRN